MNMRTFTFKKPAGLPCSRGWLTAFGALLLCVNAVQAAESAPAAAERPLELSAPQDVDAMQAWRHRQALERRNRKPYGSGYEARGLAERYNSAADVTLVPSNPTVGDNRNGGGRAGGDGAGSGRGSGAGSGGRGR
ncbi:hypothetical protein [Rhodoferax sp.]|uniref:hypothetical protein n=1 Tax=Rhodoferax sp. TaxID=50421 RepID=UPI002617F441|nr:hypothetical protein [Rhodoferax sp.]MDD2918546.1 hypothetical protein [Rhodoferax sp.]